MPVAQARLQILQVCKLLQCVRNKDKQQIEKLIAKGTPHLINYNASEQGLTALTVAAKANDDDMVGFLLGLGAHPDVVDLQGKTPSMWAAEFGNVECLERLLVAGADMTVRDIEGKGIIFYLLTPTERHLKCLDFVLKHGADVNSTSLDGNPVFVEACNLAVDNEKVCLRLLTHGADPNAAAMKSGRTPLMAACSSGGIKVVGALLAAGANPNAIDSKKNCAGHFAAMNGHIKALQLMAGYVVDFNKVANDGGNPIHYAAKTGEAMCIKFLSQRGCNPKIKNNHGHLPKVIAKEAGNKAAGTEIRKAEKSFGKGGKNNDPWVLQLYDWAQARKSMLISAFQSIDVEDVGKISITDFIDVMTTKNAPADDDQLKIVTTLQDKNKEGRIDYNDFFVAKKWVNKNFVYEAFEGKKKKKKGKRKGGKKGKFKLIMPICIQDEGSRQFGGAPPLVYVPQHIHFTDTGRFDRDKPPKHPLQDDSAWYIEAPRKSYVNINDAVKNGDIASLKDAFKQGVPVDIRDKFYKTPLMVACFISNIDLVRFLLENGANVNARDNFKWTPLHHACHAGQLDIVQLLIENGAEIDASSINGGTPLTRAIECSKDTVVQYLIERGCKVQTENKKGLTPMDLAYSWADPRVFEIVQAKWETLKPKEDKKGKKPKPKAKKGDKKESGDSKQLPVKLPDEDTLPLPRRGSILRAASALAGGLEVIEDISYIPKKIWTPQKTTKELLRDKEIKRERFGWEVDFPDYESPFQKNISTKLQEIAAEEAPKD
ncbi:ankyrin repeat and EF-hand domain-containing protein 1 [Biomphalaria pfeifferi]|uniref:Ankyrin repeat and EF-hand domain-containing protein 1 n=1 Tax=Biomphalaria pfeifferi TaxID=112525 RepID=A0AAD8B3C5_BIOPF|nr:ankyrin repeat and EF-hand domain-containing protein 1 [Biomphalaria pfeifferi]